jgi:hypothetical protein
MWSPAVSLWLLVGEVLNFNTSHLSVFIWPHNSKIGQLNHTRPEIADRSRFNSRDGSEAQNLSQKEEEKTRNKGMSVLQWNPS